jgi:hypothetical protein
MFAHDFIVDTVQKVAPVSIIFLLRMEKRITKYKTFEQDSGPFGILLKHITLLKSIRTRVCMINIDSNGRAVLDSSDMYTAQIYLKNALSQNFGRGDIEVFSIQPSEDFPKVRTLMLSVNVLLALFIGLGLSLTYHNFTAIKAVDPMPLFHLWDFVSEYLVPLESIHSVIPVNTIESAPIIGNLVQSVVISSNKEAIYQTKSFIVPVYNFFKNWFPTCMKWEGEIQSGNFPPIGNDI